MRKADSSLPKVQGNQDDDEDDGDEDNDDDEAEDDGDDGEADGEGEENDYDDFEQQCSLPFGPQGKRKER